MEHFKEEKRLTRGTQGCSTKCWKTPQLREFSVQFDDAFADNVFHLIENLPSQTTVELGQRIQLCMSHKSRTGRQKTV